MNSPVVEIHGTGTHNRGAELMAIAIAQRLRTVYDSPTIVVQPPFGSFEDRAKYGFLTTWQLPGPRSTYLRGEIVKRCPKMLHSIAGMIDPSMVQIVLDASGFAFGDQWGNLRADRLIRKMGAKNRGAQPLVLLPQAFGPFEQPRVAARARRLFDRASLVCARDKQSYDYLKPLVDPAKLRNYPDFTVLVSASHSRNETAPREDFVAICPNAKMLQETGQGVEYLDLLRGAIERLTAQGENLVFVLHESNYDEDVIKQLGGRADQLPVCKESDPRILKGVLASAKFVIGSRFHALVGALSSGVPCLGLGWSHKYPELFSQFGCGEFMQDDLLDKDGFFDRLDRLSDPGLRAGIAKITAERASILISDTATMWQEVETLIPG